MSGGSHPALLNSCLLGICTQALMCSGLTSQSHWPSSSFQSLSVASLYEGSALPTCLFKIPTLPSIHFFMLIKASLSFGFLLNGQISEQTPNSHPPRSFSPAPLWTHPIDCCSCPSEWASQGPGKIMWHKSACINENAGINEQIDCHNLCKYIREMWRPTQGLLIWGQV